jgi:dihydroorotate dehydrogenase electron transfer subunit
MRIQQSVLVESCREVASGIVVLRFDSPEIAASALPGQFVNIRGTRGWKGLLLRRPFSIARVVGTAIELLFNIVGEGTRLLSEMTTGDELDVLGPLGQPFHYRGDFDTALVVAGGLGVAPFPFLSDVLQKEEKQIVTFLGARTHSQLVTTNLRNVQIATDDGTGGFHGTVVELLDSYLSSRSVPKPKIFGCGPTRMMNALAHYASSVGIPCQLSLEGDMACGVGICQGCPVEIIGGERKYALVCTHGPAFNSSEIILQ